MHSAPSATWSQRSRWSFWPSVLLLLAVGGFESPNDAAAASYTFTVDSLGDTPDANPGDGICADATGACTLRAASNEGAALAEATLPEPCPDNFTLNVNLGVTGTIAPFSSLDFFMPTLCGAHVTIAGPGSGLLTIRGAGLNLRQPAHGISSGTVSGLTITEAPFGIQRESWWFQGGSFQLTDVVLRRNQRGIEFFGWNSTVLERTTIAENDYGIARTSGGEAPEYGLSLIDSIVESNLYSGIEVPVRFLSIHRSTIRHNGGVGIDTSGFSAIVPRVQVTESTVTGNGGYGIVNRDGSVRLLRSTISENGSGGVIIGFADESPSWVVNSTISGNGPYGQGGGIRLAAGSLDVVSTTITSNVANSDVGLGGAAGGIFVESGIPSGTVTIKNSILSGNIDVRGEAPDCGGELVSGGYNLLGDLTGCTLSGDLTGNVSSVDPGLGPLQSNGGPTETHELLVGSAALNAANPAGCTDADGALLTTDQRGGSRSQGAACDIGAFEAGCGNASVDLGEDCDDGNRFDGDCCSSLCKFEPPSSPCDDGNACTTSGGCAAGVCVGGGAPPTCDPCEVCEPSVGCTLPTSPGCSAAPSGASAVLVKNSDNNLRDFLSWRWKSPGPLPLTDIGSPVSGGTDYTLCLIDSRGGVPTLLASASTPDDGLCIDGPCWTPDPRGYRYLDRTRSNDGLLKILLRPSSTRGRIDVKGKGGGLDLPTFPLVTPVTVRLLRRDAPNCWEARFSSPLLTNDAVFRARAD